MLSHSFSYIIDKVRNASFLDSPYRHIEIEDLFEPDDFLEIVQSQDICSGDASDDGALFQNLFDRNYRIIEFPGCTQDYKEYLKWHRDKKETHKTNTACEGFGVVLRLMDAASNEVKSLQTFLQSPEFVKCLAEKFGFDPNECDYDAGIQKYLDGYEISPHPDIRRKALTYMVNINSNPNAADENHHTSYLAFQPQWKFVSEFWEGNEHIDRCWVPWDWCEVKKQQSKNNSLVIFAPSNNTLHSVKADYNHLAHQRTQLYGNLWHKKTAGKLMPKWEDFVIDVKPYTAPPPKKSLLKAIERKLPWRVTNALRKLRKSDKDSTHANREVL